MEANTHPLQKVVVEPCFLDISDTYRYVVVLVFMW